ncbi:hypothetical protein ACJRO7_002515 [Eucalyptus globulus]|uniref:Uncharacterized protein n=1 Tax=Eucalyptus globulus TaxID=34317 RepID=A0ABD3LVR6_EUCGL
MNVPLLVLIIVPTMRGIFRRRLRIIRWRWLWRLSSAIYASSEPFWQIISRSMPEPMVEIIKKIKAEITKKPKAPWKGHKDYASGFEPAGGFGLTTE